MKKQIITATLALGAILLGTNNVQAQNATDNATTTVNITLEDVISIDVASGTEVVDFNYPTAASYNQDQTVSKANSLIVTSTKAFDIEVKADKATFEHATITTAFIPVNVLTIKPVTGGSMGGTPADVNLSTTDQTLVSAAPVGSAVTLNLDYFIPLAKSSSSDILGKPSGKYTTTVTYTATAN
ncbi:hypothetical protein KCTC52924_00839 [Arenibacter antarcticus]|uniref:Peptidoglycan-binding protein LysM n=1 Tax=Arenibacter antarcticus TaxID=2040469 RepID=A0ABW5VE69_9FLAO|nr:peptidoglycan-binding protein LysM [Arenibacter sp. H213]MCM4167650.1 peptidoglycan-binding protein LysM [Arenibacter sp. H213]